MLGKNLIALLLSSFVAVSSTACAAPASEDAADSQEADVVTTTDKDLAKNLATALVGLETGGGEGDADPYKVATYKLSPSKPLDDTFLKKTVVPRVIDDPDNTADMFPAIDPGDLAAQWAKFTREPTNADFSDPESLAAAKEVAKKWRGVKQIVDSQLHDVRYADIGYAHREGGDVVGTVAHAIIGRSSTGRVFVIYGFDIWT